jgi:Alpha/beta hydrolase domain
MANEDPTPSLDERYPTHRAYVTAVRNAANALKAQRLLLDEDVQAYVQRAEASRVGR